MNRRRAALLLVLATLTASPAYAETFTWAGNDGDFSDAASWIGNAAKAGGSPSDQLVFPSRVPSGAYAVTVNSLTPFMLNSLSVQATIISIPFTPTVINAAAGLLFEGDSPTIAANLASLTLNGPIVSTSCLTISGNGSVTLNGPLSFTTPSALNVSAGLAYQNNSTPVGLTQTTISGGVTWQYVPTTTGMTRLNFGSGDITLNRGEFQIEVPQNTSAGFIGNVTNNLTVNDYGEIQTFYGQSDYSLPAPAAAFIYSGTVHLNGSLFLASDLPAQWAGTIEVDESGSVQPGVVSFSTDDLNATPMTLSGNIVDDPDPTHHQAQPLFLESHSRMTVSGAHNTYSVGTMIGFGAIFVAANSSLGTGPVDIAGGRLQISAPSNIAAGRRVLVEQSGTLAIAFDADPSALIDPASNGTLGLDTNFSTPLNLASLGNGLMSLGSTNNSTYTAATLAPDRDHVYRFQTVGGNLTLQHSVLVEYGGIPTRAELAGVILDAPNSYSGGSSIRDTVYANAPGALGTGDVTVGIRDNAFSLDTLFVSVPNTYAATAAVNVYATLAAIGATGSIPLTTTAPVFQPGSSLILGDGVNPKSDRYPDSMPIALHGSTLELNAVGITDEVVGGISFSGVSSIILQNPAPPPSLGISQPVTLLLPFNSFSPFPFRPQPIVPQVPTQSTILEAPSLSQIGNGVLFIYAVNATFDSGDASNVNIRFATPPAVVNGMVSPAIQTRAFQSNAFPATYGVSFLTYTPNGFALATYTDLPSDGGTGTEVVDAPEGVILPRDTSIYALRAGANILNPGGGATTLSIQSGGLITTAGVIIEPTVNFGNTTAYVNIDQQPYGGQTELRGGIVANAGLTKVGIGKLVLANSANEIAGPIYVLEGALELATLPSPNSTMPIFINQGAEVIFDNSVTLTRPVRLQPFTPAGYEYGYGSNIGTAAGQSLTIAAPVTGDGPSGITAGTDLTINAPITITNDLSLIAPRITINAAISANTVYFRGRVSGSGVITTAQGGFVDTTILAPGSGAAAFGTLVLDEPSFELEQGTSLELALDGTGHSDRLVVTGNLVIDDYDPTNPGDSPRMLTLSFSTPPTGEIYTLIDAASMTGTFDTVVGLPAGYALDYTPSALLLVPADVPEPGSLMMWAIVCGAVSARRRRRTAEHFNG